MNKSQMWTVIGVLVLVLIVGSVIGANISGNTIKVNGAEVYTKAEVDSKLAVINARIDALAGNTTYTCTDTDNGLNYNVKGSIKGTIGDGNTNFEDYCLSSTNLIERYCSGNNNNFTVNYYCPNGCSNGACVYVGSGGGNGSTGTTPPKTGTLTVSSNPTVALFWLDGVYKGTTQVTVYNVTTGSHTLRLEKAGYTSINQVRNITTGWNIVNIVLTKVNQTNQTG